MKTGTMLTVGAALLGMATTALAAEHKEYQGRTGLPTVREGKEKVWLEKGIVSLKVQGNDLVTTQEFRLHYPSGKLATGEHLCQVGVREDLFRTGDNMEAVSEKNAQGFRDFNVTIDDQPIQTAMDPWIVNDKKDTATRWRTWQIDFLPGDVHTMKIVSVAPLGWAGNKRTVNFVSKDIGGWRDRPDYLEIAVVTPGTADAKLVTLEPKPKTETANAARWIYRKAKPHRDVYVELPADYKGDNAQ